MTTKMSKTSVARLFMALSCLLSSGAVTAMKQPHLISEDLLAALEPQEYLYGANRLIQLPVLNQFHEDDGKGSTNSSCGYHTLRNGFILAQAAESPTLLEAKQHLAKLYDKDDMTTQLHFDGTWRSLVRADRKGDYTDNVDSYEITLLRDAEKADGFLKDKDILAPAFENAFGYESTQKEFKKFCIDNDENFGELKRKLDAGEPVIGVILVYLQKEEAKKNPGLFDWFFPKKEEKLSNKALAQKHTQRGGHWVALTAISDGHARQYILTDSAGCPGLFTKSSTIRGLIHYLEGSEKKIVPLKSLPIPKTTGIGAGADAIITQPQQLRQIFKVHKATYPANIASLRRQSGAQREKESLSYSQPLQNGVLGILAGALAFIAYNYYQNNYAQNDKKTTGIAPAIK